MFFRRLSLLVVAACFFVPASAVAQEEPPGDHSPNMTYVKNIPYEARNGDVPNFGTDQEFTKIGGKQYGLFGSYRNGMHIVDVTKPASAKVVGIYDCGITQGDVQIFRQKDERGKVFATYTSDTYGDGTSTCYLDAERLGFDAINDETAAGKNGTFIVDVTKPSSPQDRLVRPGRAGLAQHDRAPERQLALQLELGPDHLVRARDRVLRHLGPARSASRRASWRCRRGRASGRSRTTSRSPTTATRAYSAALSQGVIIDTTDPGAPEIITSFLDPAINVWHQMEDVTVGDRQFLIAEDEFAGAAGGPVCPSGGVHVYDITGDKVANPEKVGYWNIDDVGAEADPLATCTAHVFQLHEDAQVMTIAYYTGGVRVVDFSDLASISLGENNPAGGMKQIGYYQLEDADSWSAKTTAIERGEPFYVYGNDMARGLDIYQFDWEAEESASKGQWLTPAEALQRTLAAPQVDASYRLNCLLAT